jgi:membrane-associated protein
MDLVSGFVDVVLHLDAHLVRVIQDYGSWTYLILFLIIFCETGLVVAPFLPGDSLLFAAGALAAKGSFDVALLMFVLSAASFLGDNLNYWVGRRAGPAIFHKRNRFVNREHLERTERYYEEHGSKTILMARFAPVLRTFAPFVAGIGRMRYTVFLTYSFVGSIAWNACFVLGGFFFGNIPAVRDNFTAVILGIITISLLPAISHALGHRRGKVSQAS